MTSPHPSARDPVNAPVNILLVDDEVRNLDVLESVLLLPGYTLVRVDTAQKALLALLEMDIAVIVLDIQMPGTNGIELAHLIKQRPKTQHIPIIFLTAYFQEDKDVLQGYEVGAVDYLTKPIDPKILRSKVAVFAELFQKTRDLGVLNSAMETEIAHRQRAEEALREANNELEERVQERTAKLMRANEDLRTSESALKSARDEALAASRAKDAFLAALSHELRTPLNPVLLLASEAAEDAQMPAEVRSQFAMIRDNVELEARLIDDLLDLTRISRGILKLKLDMADIQALLQEAIRTVRNELDQKKILLTVDFADCAQSLLIDSVRLRQVFWNVLKNAAKFTPPKGKVTVTLDTLPETNEVVVKVTDTGIGMTSSELQRVFEAFSQGDHAREPGSHRFGGLGLGLAISRKLVELHSGTIQAFSEGRDKGSTFLIRLPMPPVPETLPSTGSPESVNGKSRPAGNISILLVEDHEPTRTILARLLKRRNYQITTASSLAEARALAGQKDFHLVISDIGLPDGEGYELMIELATRGKIKGIALTGYGMEHDLQRSQTAGFVTHLTKPVDIESLEKALLVALQ